MKDLNQFLNYLIALSVVGIAGGYFYLNQQATDAIPVAEIQSKKMTAEQQRKADESVNRYMQRANHEAKFSQYRVERELEEARKKVEEDKKAQIRREEEQQQKQASMEQIYRPPQRDETLVFPTQQPEVNKGQINASSESMPSDVKSMTPEQKREYARQYVENARKGGYSIELSDDLEVIKVTPIRKPSKQPDVYDNYPTD